MTVCCVECDHPVDDHDERTDTCWALNLFDGLVDDCACPGLHITGDPP